MGDMKYIIVNLEHEATHNWPEAREKLPEVGFLADEHRHVFHIKLMKRVEHGDRDVEFIVLKRQVQVYLREKYGRTFGRKSCEDIAEELLTQFQCVQVRVLEDGENGALVAV